MKALTLTQPWASLVAIGAKRIETRSWSTSYRGPLAIHAAKGFPKSAQEFTQVPPVSVLFGRHYEDRKSTRLNSSHPSISYAVFCLKKKNNTVKTMEST